jgi:hypothetical protein
MPKFSRERASHLARLLLDEMTRTRVITLLKDREAVRQAVAHAIADELKHEEDREERVLQKIASMRKAPAPKTRDFEALYRTMMEEEYLREGLTF